MPSRLPRLSPPAVVLSAALLGAASGLRSQTGVAAVVLRTAPDRLPHALRSKAARSVAALAALGEMVGDKYSGTPDRTEPIGLGARLGLAGVAGWLVGRSRGTSLVPEVVVGAGLAAATAFGGLALRSRLSRRFPPMIVAVAEDGLAVALALVGCMTLPSE